MPAPLSPKGQELLALMPYYYQEDPSVWSVVDTCARELQRLEDRLNLIRLNLSPQNADDAYRLLGIWEQLLGLPVEPDAPLATRRNLVLATIQGRKSGAGEDWVEAVTKAIGSSSWAHQENFPSDGQLTVTIPFAGGGYTAGQVQGLIVNLTPAHLDLIVTTDQGFLVGISEVGVEAI